ncbi:MAG: hypothetical protein JXQ90_12325 [Cyclobacteriaceae bacterium]
MKMIRKPTFAGKAQDKDEIDIIYWSRKTPYERLCESWRLHLENHGIKHGEDRLNKQVNSAKKRV